MFFIYNGVIKISEIKSYTKIIIQFQHQKHLLIMYVTMSHLKHPNLYSFSIDITAQKRYILHYICIMHIQNQKYLNLFKFVD